MNAELGYKAIPHPDELVLTSLLSSTARLRLMRQARISQKTLRENLCKFILTTIHNDRVRDRHQVRFTGSFLHQDIPALLEWAKNGFRFSATVLARVEHIETMQRYGFRNPEAPSVRGRIWLLAYAYGTEKLVQLYEDNIYLPSWVTENGDPLFAEMVGGARAFAEFLEEISSLLDFVYLAIHGDYAVQIANALQSVGVSSFATSQSGQYQELYEKLWQKTNGPYYKRVVEKYRTERVEPWINLDRPKAASTPDWPPRSNEENNKENKVRSRDPTLGFQVNEIVATRLETLHLILGGDTLKDSEGQEIKVILNAGAYPEGGRKPPSVTHGSTCGVDLDLDPVPNLSSRIRLPGTYGVDPSEMEQKVLWALLRPIITFFPISFGSGTTTYYGTRWYRAVVTFVQALLITIPSRLYFGDAVSLVSAYGGLMDAIGEKSKSADLEQLLKESEGVLPQDKVSAPSALTENSDAEKESVQDKEPPPEEWITTYISFEPSGHHNHFHVDWLDEKLVTASYSPIPDWAFGKNNDDIAKLQKWNLLDVVKITKDRRKIYEDRPIKHRDQMVRPVQLYDRAIAVGPARYVNALYTLLGGENIKLPLGGDDIENPKKLLEWYERYFYAKKGTIRTK